jgi:hypothetical protein
MLFQSFVFSSICKNSSDNLQQDQAGCKSMLQGKEQRAFAQCELGMQLSDHVCCQKGFSKLITLENYIGVSFMLLFHAKVAYFLHLDQP